MFAATARPPPPGSNDRVHLPGRLGELEPWESLHAAPARCTAQSGVLVSSPNQVRRSSERRPGRCVFATASRAKPDELAEFALHEEDPATPLGVIPRAALFRPAVDVPPLASVALEYNVVRKTHRRTPATPK